MVVVVNRDSASNEPKVVYKSKISRFLLLHIYNTFVVSCLSAFSDLGLATDPCTACPSLSLSCAARFCLCRECGTLFAGREFLPENLWVKEGMGATAGEE